jgi:hypothetical protein
MIDGRVPDLFVVALAALNLLAEAADRIPLLLLVDDAHWLDPPSVQALGFIARRIESEPIAVLVALRDGHVGPLDLAGLPELSLSALDAQAAAALLDARARPPAPPGELRERVSRPRGQSARAGGGAAPGRWRPSTSRSASRRCSRCR